ncbi:MAG: hypothetical protein ACPF9D_08125, partial [Owenweeksia sp.]
AAQDTSGYPIAEAYLDISGSDALLFKGKAYDNYTYYIAGTAFFERDEWQEGSLYYDGVLYTGLSLKMELVQGKPVIFYKDLVFPIMPSPERISWFTLGNSRFERLVRANDESAVPETGFYQLAYAGSTSLWIKHEKEIKSEIRERQLRYWFEAKSTYYIEKDNEFHRIRGRGSLLRALAEHRNEIKAHLKDMDLSVRKNPELAIREAMRYYDELKGWEQ